MQPRTLLPCLLALLAFAVPAAAAQEPPKDEPARPEIEFSIEQRSKKLKRGAKAWYRVIVRNEGDAVAQDVLADVKLSQGLDRVRGGVARSKGRLVRFDLGDIKPGRRKTRTLVVRIASGAETVRLTGRAYTREDD